MCFGGVVKNSMFKRPKRFPVLLRCRVLTMALFLSLPIFSMHDARGEGSSAATSSTTIAVTEPAEVWGTATYYAKRFHGHRTASGAVYRHEKMTAAHTCLPFGSKVRVLNPANGREVVVTVTDRCRPRKKPFIDLSRAAAKQLGILGKGRSPVRIIPLGKD